MSIQLVIETEQENGICIVRIGGPLRSGTDDAYLKVKGQEIKAMACTRLLIDLHELRSTGSSGMGFFVDLYASVTKRGGRMVLAGPTKLVREVLDLTRLSTIIPVTPDVAAGVAYLRAAAGAAGGKNAA